MENALGSSAGAGVAGVGVGIIWARLGVFDEAEVVLLDLGRLKMPPAPYVLPETVVPGT